MWPVAVEEDDDGYSVRLDACERCDGSGRLDHFYPPLRCGACDGRGEVEVEFYALDVDDWDECWGEPECLLTSWPGSSPSWILEPPNACKSVGL